MNKVGHVIERPEFKVRHIIELEIVGEDAIKVNNIINYIESIIEDEKLGVIESTETTVITGE